MEAWNKHLIRTECSWSPEQILTNGMTDRVNSRPPAVAAVRGDGCNYCTLIEKDHLGDWSPELRIFLAHNEINILSINKTKLNETISDNEVNILGYDIVRRDRTTDGGGGVCFYVKKLVNFTVRNDLNMETLKKLCLEIQQPRSKPFVVVTWYRPPDSPIGIFSSFEHLIGILDLENTEYYLMGDLNCDMIATRYDNDTCNLMSITDV